MLSICFYIRSMNMEYLPKKKNLIIRILQYVNISLNGLNYWISVSSFSGICSEWNIANFVAIIYIDSDSIELNRKLN